MLFKNSTSLRTYALWLACIFLTLELAASLSLRLLPKDWLVDRAEVEDAAGVILKARRQIRHKPYVLVLGDSVMAAGALGRAGQDQPHQHTTPSYLAERIRQAGLDWPVLNLGMEGALGADYLGLFRLLDAQNLRPSLVLVQIDYRVLSPHQDAAQHISRPWLAPFVSEHAARLVGLSTRANASQNKTIDKLVHDKVLLRSDLYILIRALRQIPKTVGAEGGPGRIEGGDPTEKAVLSRLVGRFYGLDKSILEGKALKVLEALLDELRDLNLPTLVCFTPANFDFLGEQANVPVYFYNLNALQKWFEGRYGRDAGLGLAVLENTVPSSLFLDHCHLNPEGNRIMAGLIFDRLALFRSGKR